MKYRGSYRALLANRFEVVVAVQEHSGQRHPVVVVADGVKVPVAVKRSLAGPGGKPLLTVDDIYFRTLVANGTASSAKVQHRDLPDLVEVCFENREADIGRFLRRHLGSGDASAMLAAIAASRSTDELSFVTGSTPTPAEDEALCGLVGQPSRGSLLQNQAVAVIHLGNELFQKALLERPLETPHAWVLSALTMRVGLVLDPRREASLPTQEFMNSIGAANPQYTGWPVWLDSRGFHEALDRPRVIDGAWQALIFDLNGGWSQHFEFMRFDPNGAFFLRRAMQDDLTDKIPRSETLDVVLMIYRIAEVLAVGVSIAKGAGWTEADRAGFAFDWTGLAGRRLGAWANPLRSFGVGGGGLSAMNEAKSFVEVPLDTPHSALAPFVAVAAGALFSCFDGYQPPQSLIEDCVQKMVERRM
jgi:hypothetical protein